MTNSQLIHYLLSSSHIKQVENVTFLHVIAVLSSDVIEREFLLKIMKDAPHDFHIVGNHIVFVKK